MHEILWFVFHNFLASFNNSSENSWNGGDDRNNADSERVGEERAAV
jgi:trehalose-6-phosphate synthase